MLHSRQDYLRIVGIQSHHRLQRIHSGLEKDRNRHQMEQKAGGCPVQWGHSTGQIEVVNLAVSEVNALVLQACVWERPLGSCRAVHVSSWEYRFVAVEAQVAS